MPMNGADLERLRLQISDADHTSVPGGRRRRAAARELAAEPSAQTVPLLIRALADDDAEVKAAARGGLSSLSDPAAVDAYCAAWAADRHPQLGQILLACGYLARQPVGLRVLCACKLGRVEEATRGGAEVVPALLTALEDRDEAVKATASRALSSLSDPAAVDACCEMLIREDRPGLARLAREHGWAPADASRRCLFLLLSDQVEVCCQLDPECKHLRAEYAQAEESLRRRVREKVLAAGDDRLVGALSGALGLDVSIAIHARNRNCAALFACIESASYRQTVHLLDLLAVARWEPAEEADRFFLSALQNLRRRIREMGDAQADFEGLLADPSLEARSVAELRALIMRSDPRGRARALVALASRDGASAAGLVPPLLANPNWELRLGAALAASHGGSGASRQAFAELLDDRNHWVASAGVQGLIQGLRGFGSVEDLYHLEEARTRAEERLRASPGHAEQAGLVLQLLLAVLRRSIREFGVGEAGEEMGGEFEIEIIGE